MKPEDVVRLTPAGYRAIGRPGIAAYLEEPLLAGDDAFEAARRALYLRAHQLDESGERCDRALIELGGRFAPTEVHRFSRAVASLVSSVIYGREKAARLRRADLLAEVLAEVAAIHEEKAA